jgi:ParB/RepB/Spo0J family partition protein
MIATANTPIPQKLLTEKNYRVQLIPVDKIYADEEFNCRGKILPMDVIDLAKDIAKNKLQTPITVQPWDKMPNYTYRCVAGYRRLTAFKVNKELLIPCFVEENLSDLDARKINLKENLIRKDLNVMQEARAIQPYLVAHYTEEEIAKEFEQSRGWVQIRKVALQLPAEIQKEIAAGLISQENIRRLSRLRNKDEQFALVRKIKDAVDKGEKVKLDKPIRKIAPYDRKHRSASEIFEMNKYLLDLLGPFIGTRLLAWAAGAISDIELSQDIREFCEENSYTYEPHEGIAKLVS